MSQRLSLVVKARCSINITPRTTGSWNLTADPRHGIVLSRQNFTPSVTYDNSLHPSIRVDQHPVRLCKQLRLLIWYDDERCQFVFIYLVRCDYDLALHYWACSWTLPHRDMQSWRLILCIATIFGLCIMRMEEDPGTLIFFFPIISHVSHQYNSR